MNKIVLMTFLVLTLILSACTAPPEDLPQAQVVEEQEETQEQEVVEGSEEETKEAAENVDEEETEEASEESETESSDDMARAKAIDTATSSVTFEGFAVGKSHEGTFDDWRGEFYYDDDGMLTGAKGVIQTASVNTGIGGLDSHLQKDDFFDSEVYPEIVIESTEVGEDSVTAELTFRGVTKTINFPAEVTENSISADFTLDTTDFAMTNTGVNKEVRIALDLTTV